MSDIVQFGRFEIRFTERKLCADGQAAAERSGAKLAAPLHAVRTS